MFLYIKMVWYIYQIHGKKSSFGNWFPILKCQICEFGKRLFLYLFCICFFKNSYYLCIVFIKNG